MYLKPRILIDVCLCTTQAIVYFNVMHALRAPPGHAELFFILMISAAPLANSNAVLKYISYHLVTNGSAGCHPRKREHVQQTICRAWEAIVA